MRLKDRLRDEFSEEELQHVRNSFDIVGNIAIIKVPKEIEHRKQRIADAVMEQHNRVKTVLRKVEQRSGTYRTAEYEVLKGGSTETVHTEHGCRFKLDPTQVYFSERLGRERQRVVEQADAGETVIDMFAGIGPFTIMLARNAGVDAVHAFEANPDAVAYLRENVRLNGVSDTVQVYAGDVAEELPGHDITADRIIMNLPKESDQFIDTALAHATPGATVHYYTFVDKDDMWDAAEETAHDVFSAAGAETRIADRAVCGHYSPAVERVCFDVVVETPPNR